MPPRPGKASSSRSGTATQLGCVVAKEVVRGVANSTITKKIGQGRRLGGSRSLAKNIEAGIKRVVDLGMEKVAKAGGLGKFVKKGISSLKREGFTNMAEKVMNFASQGLVKINPSGFAVVFKPNQEMEILFRKNPLEGLDENLLTEEEVYKKSPRVRLWRPESPGTPEPPNNPFRPIDVLHHNVRYRFVKTENPEEQFGS